MRRLAWGASLTGLGLLVAVLSVLFGYNLVLGKYRSWLAELAHNEDLGALVGTPAVVRATLAPWEQSGDLRTIPFSIRGPNGRGNLYFVEAHLGKEWLLYRLDLARDTRAPRIPVLRTDELADRGWKYADAGELDQAFAAFDLALKLDPRDAWAYNNRALTYASAGKWDSAFEDFALALKYEPDEPAIYSSRGQVWAEKNEDAKAIADFEQAIALDPAGPDAYCLLAALYEAEGSPGRARRTRARLEAARRQFGIGDDALTQARKLADDFKSSLLEPDAEE